MRGTGVQEATQSRPPLCQLQLGPQTSFAVGTQSQTQPSPMSCLLQGSTQAGQHRMCVLTSKLAPLIPHMGCLRNNSLSFLGL